jgi:[lysine-biosynthesis-protein LysW]--L-2-aminoadipate ligase
MRLLIAADTVTPTNARLVRALRARGLQSHLVPAGSLAARAGPTDTVLGRVDVLPTLDGASSCLWTLRRIEERGVRVLNSAAALLTAHDKLLTAVRLGRVEVAHPATAHVDERAPVPDLRFPVVVKPRFGSWGRDVFLCRTKRDLTRLLPALRDRRWFRRQGAVVQELVAPCGYDLRLLVARGVVIGGIERVSAPGEWRTNVSLGARRRRIEHVPPEAATLAVRAAGALATDLAGVDLLPTEEGGWTVLEVNGAVDFTTDYALDGGDVFDDAARALEEACREGS